MRNAYTDMFAQTVLMGRRIVVGARIAVSSGSSMGLKGLPLGRRRLEVNEKTGNGGEGLAHGQSQKHLVVGQHTSTGLHEERFSITWIELPQLPSISMISH